MKNDLMTRVQENPLWDFAVDQFERQRLASLGLMSFGLKAVNGFVSDPGEQVKQVLNLGPEAWKTLNRIFTDMVEEGRRVRSAKAK